MRDLFLFKLLADGQDTTDVFQTTKAGGFKTGSNLVFKGWKKKTAQVIHVLIDPFMDRLRDGRNLPSSWEEYKLVKGSAGALCFTCWANVCKTKGYGV